jgi:DNA modification methylase
MATTKEIKEKYKTKKRTGEKPVDLEGLAVNGHKIQIEYVPISKLNAAVYNPRTMDNAEMTRLCKGISEFGFVDPVIVNTNGNVIVGGHQRTRAAQLLGMTEVPVAWVTLDKKKEKALNIALNRISGEWKTDELLELLKELSATTDFDMSLTGFDDEELKALLGDDKDDLGDEDAEVEPEENPFVKFGDLWIWGDHKLLVGDSTNLQDVNRLIGNEKIDLVVTDPPYGISYESKAGKIENDDLKPKQLEEFLTKAFSSMSHALKPGGCWYCYHADGGELGKAFRDAIAAVPELMNKATLIWVKSSATLCRSDYNMQHEPVLYGWKAGASHYYDGDFTRTSVVDDDIDINKLDKKALQNIINDLRQKVPTTVIRVDKPAKSELHPTTKPVRLYERNIYASSRTGELCLDLFSGSGTLIIACRKTGRKGRAIEFDPKYAQASLRRMLQYDGTEPMLQNSDGTTTPFSKVEQDRKKKK